MAKRPTKPKNTNIYVSEEIDTPYPYCIIHKKHESISDQVERAQLALQNRLDKPRSLFTITTWDGRELFNLEPVDD